MRLVDALGRIYSSLRYADATGLPRDFARISGVPFHKRNVIAARTAGRMKSGKDPRSWIDLPEFLFPVVEVEEEVVERLGQGGVSKYSVAEHAVFQMAHHRHLQDRHHLAALDAQHRGA